jgi:hypothetical protein
LKHEIRREPGSVSAHGLIEGFRFYSVKNCKIGVEQDPLVAQGHNGIRDSGGLCEMSWHAAIRCNRETRQQ